MLLFNATSQNCTGITQILLDRGLVLSNGCTNTEVGDPFLYFEDSENACDVGIERYLSRTVNMEFFAKFNTSSPCWIGSAPPLPAEANCTPPYNLCYGRFCPEKYYEGIKMLVNINAQFIARVATAWGDEGSFAYPNGAYRMAAKQLVCDINAAYDCAGLRRPIIQAGIFEGVNSQVSAVKIPTDIIQFFTNEMSPSEHLYYGHYTPPSL